MRWPFVSCICFTNRIVNVNALDALTKPSSIFRHFKPEMDGSKTAKNTGGGKKERKETETSEKESERGNS